MTTSDTPVCERADQLEGKDGQRVRLIGTYRAVATPKKMARPGHAAETADLGYVVIVLERGADADLGRVKLGEDPRPREEIAELDGRSVQVEGRLTLAPGAAGKGAARKAGPVLRNPTAPSPV